MANNKGRSSTTQTTKKQTVKRKRQSRQAREQELRRNVLFVVGGAAVLLAVISLIVVIVSHSGKSKASETVPAEDIVEMTETADADLVDMIPIAEIADRPEVMYADKPDIDIHDWKYLLANSTHSVSDYEPIIDYLEGVPLDYRVIEPMSEFIEGARRQGLNVIIASGYRSYEEQQWTFDLQLQMMDEEEAATVVARPGTSEHQTGLAADITDDYYEIKTEDLENTDLYKWMSAHCQEYGFIVRFPKDKEDVTKIIYEPWHFRYVGEEAAKYITEKGLCLEEFVALYE